MNVFTGRKYLKFERYPDYITGGKNPSFKIKTLLDLGFTKLVLRIKATGYTQEAIDLACLAFPHVSCALGLNVENIGEDFDSTGFCRTYCYNYDLELMGSIEDFRNWYKYDIVCFHGCPTGVLYARRLDKYFGFSHRAAAEFGIGDILFDESWKPGWDEVRLEWVQKYCKACGYKIPSSIEEAKTFVKLYTADGSVLEHIPFKFRGDKEITSKKEAILAAKNFSRYVS